MKYALVLASLLLTQTAANAASAAKCAFGESTADLSEHLDLQTGAPGKIWYKGEHLSLHQEVRLKGLTSTERKMILMAGTTDDEQSEKQTLKDFSSSDGYLTYFSHNSLNREFVIVASYPGDNEYGAILEIKRLKRGADYSILRVVAVIGDGDLESCIVSKDEVKE